MDDIKEQQKVGFENQPHGLGVCVSIKNITKVIYLYIIELKLELEN